MKLKNGFVTHESSGKLILLSAGGGFNGLVKSNKAAAFICLRAMFFLGAKKSQQKRSAEIFLTIDQRDFRYSIS